MSPEQIVLIGLAASVITQLLKFLGEQFDIVPPREVVVVALFAISIGLSAAFGLPEFVGSSDPAEFARLLLEAAITVVGSATLIYKLLLEKVVFPFAKIG